MTDLPAPSQASNQPINQFADSPIGQSNTAVSGKGKEVGETSSELPLVEVSRPESGLSKEVRQVGVGIRPTTIAIPSVASQLGVKPAGDNVVLGTGRSVTLPLTDVQIAFGLKQGAALSWRWLAEWCKRRLKQLGRTLTRL